MFSLKGQECFGCNAVIENSFFIQIGHSSEIWYFCIRVNDERLHGFDSVLKYLRVFSKSSDRPASTVSVRRLFVCKRTSKVQRNDLRVCHRVLPV